MAKANKNNDVKVYPIGNGRKWIKDKPSGKHILIDKKGNVSVFDDKKQI